MRISFGLQLIVVSAATSIEWSNNPIALDSGSTSVLAVQLQRGTPKSVESPDPESPLTEPPTTKPDPEIKSDPSKPAARMESLCSAIEREASSQGLPVQLFARLIWQESRLDPLARSHAGAQGIAQFMPRTARWRGLANPFEPYAALHESARWLRELRDQFGNLGLAAAAYNAGPARIQEWLEHRGTLPNETRAYVKIITGRSAEEWVRVGKSAEAGPSNGNPMPCLEDANFAAAAPKIQPQSTKKQPQSPQTPWAVQLIGDPSETKALAEYRALQQKHPSILGDRSPVIIKTQVGAKGSGSWFRVRVAAVTRERATELCAQLRSGGGSCLVTKN